MKLAIPEQIVFGEECHVCGQGVIVPHVIEKADGGAFRHFVLYAKCSRCHLTFHHEHAGKTLGGIACEIGDKLPREKYRELTRFRRCPTHPDAPVLRTDRFVGDKAFCSICFKLLKV